MPLVGLNLRRRLGARRDVLREQDLRVDDIDQLHQAAVFACLQRQGESRFVIGFIKNFASSLGFSRWSEFLVFMVLTFVLIFKPSGLFGHATGDRA